MRLSTLLKREAIIVPLENFEKSSLIEELLDAAARTGQVIDRDKALQALLEREKLGSTGLEKGLAIPHARTNAVDGIVMAVGVAPDGVDFQSADGEPTRLFFLLLASEAVTSSYVQVLALIARLNLQSGFRRKMQEATSPDEIIEIVRQAEE
jgi:mannitol/fructose-specific phosphotransferase system IIA component (Ntr-type)